MLLVLQVTVLRGDSPTHGLDGAQRHLIWSVAYFVCQLCLSVCLSVPVSPDLYVCHHDHVRVCVAPWALSPDTGDAHMTGGVFDLWAVLIVVIVTIVHYRVVRVPLPLNAIVVASDVIGSSRCPGFFCVSRTNPALCTCWL